MNLIESYIITNPQNKEDLCAKITVDDLTDKFVLSGIAVPNQKYMLSFWVKSEAAGNIKFRFQNYPTSKTWKKYSIPFTSEEDYLLLKFSTLGTYYIYHMMLEVGDKATDWKPAPEDTEAAIGDVDTKANSAQNTADDAAKRVADAEASIKLLADSISMLVTDENGQSLMTQTSDGWTFCTKDIQAQLESSSSTLAELVDKLGSTEAAIDLLSNSVDEFGEIAEFIHLGEYTYVDEDGVSQTEPSIDMFETDTGFKLKITNTRIVFTDGATELLTINSKTKSLMTPKAIIENELQMGSDSRTDGVWIWKQRTNGNLGLMWRGGSS